MSHAGYDVRQLMRDTVGIPWYVPGHVNTPIESMSLMGSGRTIENSKGRPMTSHAAHHGIHAF